MLHICSFASPVGPLMAACDGESIVGLWLEGQKNFASTLREGEYDQVEDKDFPVLNLLKKWLDVYFKGKEPEISLPLAPEGTPFRKDVWDILLQIPFGQVTTYKEVAKKLEKKYGKPQCARSVGGAVGHNPISIIIPCHRVVGSSGYLTGYAGGIDKKIQLLQVEHVNVREKPIQKVILDQKNGEK